MTRIAVVGGGVAGLGVALSVGDDADVTIFERAERIGGRAATREREGCVYDVGANYVKSDDDRVSTVIHDLDNGLVETEGSVWTFDADGEIYEGRDEETPKLTYRTGLGTLGERLCEASDAAVRTDTRISRLRRNEAWYVEDADGNEYGQWDALVLTPPAPITASLLDLAEWEGDACRELREHVGHIPYRPILTVALHYSFEIERPYYALVNADKDHDVGWLARESCKPGHVPDGESLLVVQMAPGWSASHYDDDDFDVATEAADRTADLLSKHPLAAPDWYDVIRWRDALPDDGADTNVLRKGASSGLFFAGDWVAGDGRVHRALSTGLKTGDELRD